MRRKKMGQFNLIDEPWISVVVDKTGQTQEVSSASLLENAHLYKRIAGDTVTQDFTLRVLFLLFYIRFSPVLTPGRTPMGTRDLMSASSSCLSSRRGQFGRLSERAVSNLGRLPGARDNFRKSSSRICKHGTTGFICWMKKYPFFK